MRKVLLEERFSFLTPAFKRLDVQLIEKTQTDVIHMDKTKERKWEMNMKIKGA